MSFLRFLLFLPTMVVLAVLAFFSSGDVKTEIWPFLGENGEPLVVEIKIIWIPECVILACRGNCGQNVQAG